MPAGKRQQSNAMLYTLITFISLFIIVTVAAVVLYVKLEEQIEIANSAVTERDEMSTSSQWQRRGTIVGAKKPRETYIGKMVEYVDQMVSLTLGGPAGDDSAEAKFTTVQRKTKETVDVLSDGYIQISEDPNTVGLIRIAGMLKDKVDNLTDGLKAANEQNNKLQQDFQVTVDTAIDTEKKLLEEKDRYKQQVETVQQDYRKLEALLNQSSEEQVQNLLTQVQELRNDRDQTHRDLLRTQSQLNQTKGKLDIALADVRKTEPVPDANVAAFKEDGNVIAVDDLAGIVHLNIGSDDKVYPGLTFAIYDRTTKMPKDGKGKAEVEIFDVGKKVSTARIVYSEKRNPIVVNDIAANLIWDTDKPNIFVVAGDFDLNADGFPDFDAIEKISAYIENWGGRAMSRVSINTDFIVLGDKPPMLRKPTFEDIEEDPMAMQKYESSEVMGAQYDEVLQKAQALSVPVFSYERFLYLIGYKTQSHEPGAF